MDSISDSVVRLAAVTGLPLEEVAISLHGIAGKGARVMSMPQGRGLIVALTRTVSSTAATVLPEEAAGWVVRSLGRWAQDNPIAWADLVRDLDARGLMPAVTVNHEMLDDPTEPPNGLWRSFSIECWTRSPAKTHEDVVMSLVAVAGPALSLAMNGIMESADPESAPNYEALPEGASTTIKVNRYERNPVNRFRCIERYGVSCWACDTEFGTRYGPIASGYIEVHHRVPVSMLGENYMVDPVRDLVPLCSNCHSVAHRRNPPLQPSEIRELLKLPPKTPLPDLVSPAVVGKSCGG